MFHHLFFYDPRTLAKILETHYGYEVVAAEGDPVIGLKSIKLEESWRARLSYAIRRKHPILESSFRLVARKPVAAVRTRRAAA